MGRTTVTISGIIWGKNFVSSTVGIWKALTVSIFSYAEKFDLRRVVRHLSVILYGTLIFFGAHLGEPRWKFQEGDTS